ncbi:hypothetical protein TNCV_1419821 [Trichonephila clavipes]|nr:hypothetical protein TNCV_1419821 [Trichonephila clavipes]
MCMAVLYYRECKLLSDINVSEKAGKVSNVTNVLDFRRLTTLLKTLKKVSGAARQNRLQTITESVGISSTSCQWILTKNLNRHRVCQHIVPRMLKDDQSAD